MLASGRRLLIAGLCVCQTLAGVAHAADSSEFWPEVSGFVKLSPRTRLYVDAAFAEGKESETKSLDLAAYLDISLKPIARKELLQEDWQRSRYLWARIGEWFYDTRYDGWARVLYQLGPEVTVSQHFRYEIYVARQNDRLPSASSTNAFGVVAKWYY